MAGFRWTRLRFWALAALVLVSLLSGSLRWTAGQEGSSATTGAAWANPSAIAIKKFSDITTSQTHPNFLSNLDCYLFTYRLPNSGTMQTGCFTDTAFGYLDADSDTALFNGTDEGLPLVPYTSKSVLVPWPRAANLLALDATATGGSYVSLYNYPLSHLDDQRDYLGKLAGKHLNAPPDITLKDPSGQRLVINAQTVAFSNSGSWLVAESLTGYFWRINLSTLDMVPFAKSFAASGMPGTFKSDISVTNDGHYVAINNEYDGSTNVYDLSNCASTSAQPLVCPHSDYRKFIKGSVPGLRAIRSPRFVNDGLLRFEVDSSTSTENGSYVLAPAGSIPSLTDYIGLGDSFTSGEGAFDYRSGTDTSDNMCHASSWAYPMLLTHDVFTSGGGHSVACSGAVINDVGSTDNRYRGQVRNGYSYSDLGQTQSGLLASVELNYMPGYIAQHRFVQQYQPKIITVSAGGDDIGFGDILEECLAPHVLPHHTNNTCYDTYEDRQEVANLIDKTTKRWQQLFRQLADDSPLTTIYAVGYPDIIDDTGTCGLNVYLDKSEREFAKELVAYINSSLQQATVGTTAHYIDVNDALAGHRLCETDSSGIAMNGVTAGTDFGFLGLRIFGRESYHPNALGQHLMEQAILKQTHNLTLYTPATTIAKPIQFLSKPKTGRTIVVKIPGRILSNKQVKKGTTVHVSYSGASAGLRANTVYTVQTGAGNQVIGTISSDANGDLEGDAHIPSDATSGGTTIIISGPGQTGDPTVVTQPIYVEDSNTDADGDGVPNAIDSCPLLANAGVDVDHDGIDDACDGVIGISTTPPSNSPPTSEIPLITQTPSGTGGLDSTIHIISTPSALSGTQNASIALQPSIGLPKSGNAKNIITSVKSSVPATLAAISIPPPQVGAPNVARPSKQVLPSINWLHWAKLACVAWLLFVIALMLARFIAATRRDHAFDGQGTVI
jgi:hypothetical protein